MADEMTNDKRDELTMLVTPLCQWLHKNKHPHTKIIIDSTTYEMVEGVYAGTFDHDEQVDAAQNKIDEKLDVLTHLQTALNTSKILMAICEEQYKLLTMLGCQLSGYIYIPHSQYNIVHNLGLLNIYNVKRVGAARSMAYSSKIIVGSINNGSCYCSGEGVQPLWEHITNIIIDLATNTSNSRMVEVGVAIMAILEKYTNLITKKDGYTILTINTDNHITPKLEIQLLLKTGHGVSYIGAVYTK